MPSSVHSAVRSSETLTKLDACPNASAPIGTVACVGSSPVSLRLLNHRAEPLPLLDFATEEREIFGALWRARKDIRAVSTPATSRNLRQLLTDGVVCLHYCGHGLLLGGDGGGGDGRFCLVLEDGSGGTHLLPAADLEALVAAGGHALQLVVVSACFSHGGGAAFVAAGVPHVIAVKRAERIQDRAAAVFAEAFYYAVLRGGKTVQQAFDIGRSAVANACGIVEAHSEAEKFVLLPRRAAMPSLRQLRGRRAPRWLGAASAVQPSRLIAAHRPPARMACPRRRIAPGASDSPPSSAPPASASPALHLPGLSLVDRRHFGGGVLYASLAGATDAAALAAAVARALREAGKAPPRKAAIGGRRKSDGGEIEGALTSLLSPLKGHPALLFLDEAEALLRSAAGRDAMRSLVVGALGRLPELRILFSCATALPLSGVGVVELRLSPLPPADCARLFLQLAPRVPGAAEVFDGRQPRQALQAEVESTAALLSLQTEQLQLIGGLGRRRRARAAANHVRALWALPMAQADAVVAALDDNERLALTVHGRRRAAADVDELTLGLHVQRGLARHPVLRAANGNPRAIAQLAPCVAPAVPRRSSASFYVSSRSLSRRFSLSTCAPAPTLLTARRRRATTTPRSRRRCCARCEGCKRCSWWRQPRTPSPHSSPRPAPPSSSRLAQANGDVAAGGTAPNWLWWATAPSPFAAGVVGLLALCVASVLYPTADAAAGVPPQAWAVLLS